MMKIIFFDQSVYNLVAMFAGHDVSKSSNTISQTT